MTADAETNPHAQSAANAMRQDPALLSAAGRTLLAFASQPGVMFGLKDAADGRYLAASESMAAFYGRPPDQVIGHSDTELLDPTLGAAMRAAARTSSTVRGALLFRYQFFRHLAHSSSFDWSEEGFCFGVLPPVDHRSKLPALNPGSSLPAGRVAVSPSFSFFWNSCSVFAAAVE